ncbi:MAG: hypothetical protein HUJ65_02410 [Oscillospiraceae bacterium]|nr:hypothetical protein [Oscillospiraceae bacterium]
MRKVSHIIGDWLFTLAALAASVALLVWMFCAGRFGGSSHDDDDDLDYDID